MEFRNLSRRRNSRRLGRVSASLVAAMAALGVLGACTSEAAPADLAALATDDPAASALVEWVDQFDRIHFRLDQAASAIDGAEDQGVVMGATADANEAIEAAATSTVDLEQILADAPPSAWSEVLDVLEGTDWDLHLSAQSLTFRMDGQREALAELRSRLRTAATLAQDLCSDLPGSPTMPRTSDIVATA